MAAVMAAMQMEKTPKGESSSARPPVTMMSGETASE